MALDASGQSVMISFMDRWISRQELRPAWAEEGEAKRVDVCPSINKPVRSSNTYPTL